MNEQEARKTVNRIYYLLKKARLEGFTIKSNWCGQNIIHISYSGFLHWQEKFALTEKTLNDAGIITKRYTETILEVISVKEK